MRKLAKRRENAGYTVRALADEAGVSPTTISGIETGRIKSPQYASVVKLARVLGVEPQEVEEFRPVVQAVEGLAEERTASQDTNSQVSRQEAEEEGDLASQPPEPPAPGLSDRELAENEDIVGFVEAEASNATGVDPAEAAVMEAPELVRIGLRSVLRSIMAHLGREEIDRAYRRVFGAEPPKE